MQLAFSFIVPQRIFLKAFQGEINFVRIIVDPRRSFVRLADKDNRLRNGKEMSEAQRRNLVILAAMKVNRGLVKQT